MEDYVIKSIIEEIEKSSVDWKEGACGNRHFSLKKYHQQDSKKVLRSEFGAQLEALENDGLIRCEWYDRPAEAKEVIYNLKDRHQFYMRLQRREKYIRINLMKEYILEFTAFVQKDWICKFGEELYRKLECGKIPSELDKVDKMLQNVDISVDNWWKQAEKCGYLQLFSALKGLNKLKEPVYKRIFSSNVFMDETQNGKLIKASKVFENIYQSKIISLAKKYDQDNIDENMNDSQVLEQLYIEDYSQTLSLKGSLKIVIEEKTVDLGAFTYGIVLNSETLKKAKPDKNQRIRKIITVENQANYEKLQFENDTLIIFSHGYFTPKEKMFLVQLAEILEDSGQEIEYYHTGDLDYGGICIYRYIKEKIFPRLQPMNMSVEQYWKYQNKAEPMTKEQINGLKKINVPELDALIQLLLKEGKCIEQENFMLSAD